MSDVAKVRSRSVGRRPIHRLELRAFRRRRRGGAKRSWRRRLNAPSDAQCFPTRHPRHGLVGRSPVSMHLLVLSAFRRLTEFVKTTVVLSQCTFWCSVLSDRLKSLYQHASSGLNVPSGAQCFPTLSRRRAPWRQRPVSMHLLVLSAFRPCNPLCETRVGIVSMHLLVLSAFRLGYPRREGVHEVCVSMHLLVLSAFRLEWEPEGNVHICVSQCTFWCSVLSDLDTVSLKVWVEESQCTFWCSVLSDGEKCLNTSHRPLCLNAPSGAQCFPTKALDFLATVRYGLNAPSGAQCFPTREKA